MLAGAQAQTQNHPQAEAQALDIAKRSIAFRSVAGPGNQTPQVAELYKSALVFIDVSSSPENSMMMVRQGV